MDTKIKFSCCKDCFKTFRAGTAKCPYCQTYQKKVDRVFDSRYLPKIWISFSVALGTNIPLFFDYSALNRVNNPQGLYVENISFKAREETFGSSIMLLSDLKNTTQDTYENFYFHVTFFNKNNEIIDELSTQQSSLLAPKNNSVYFKILKFNKINIDSLQHASAKIEIIRADKL